VLPHHNSANQNNDLCHLNHPPQLNDPQHSQLNVPQPIQQYCSQPSQVNNPNHIQSDHEDSIDETVPTSLLSTYNPILQLFRIIANVIHVLDNILNYMFFGDEHF